MVAIDTHTGQKLWSKRLLHQLGQYSEPFDQGQKLTVGDRLFGISQKRSVRNGSRPFTWRLASVDMKTGQFSDRSVFPPLNHHKKDKEESSVSVAVDKQRMYLIQSSNLSHLYLTAYKLPR